MGILTSGLDFKSLKVESDGVVPPTEGLAQSSILAALHEAAMRAEEALKAAISRKGILNGREYAIVNRGKVSLSPPSVIFPQ